MKALWPSVFLLALLAATVTVSYWAWGELEGVEIGRHGLIALVLGVGGTLLLGAGLIFLMHVSHRRGFDDRIRRPDEKNRE